MSFCPRCGKPTEHQFCLDCLRELHPLISAIREAKVTICPVCFKIFSKSSWAKKDLQETVRKQLDRSLTFAQNSRIDDVLLEPAEPEAGPQVLQITVVGSADPEGPAYEEYYEVPLMIQGNRCIDCERLANTYFTGILQLRRPNEIVQHEIERLLQKYISSIKDVTGGIDYYVTNHHQLQNVVRQVHFMYGGELTVRAQHFSYDSLASKNLYRVNACLRLPKYWKGSVIEAGTKLVQITSMGKIMKGVDIATGKPVSVPTNNDYQEHPIQETTIVTTRPTVTVLHPDTFQTIPIANDREEWTELTAGDKVRVTIVDERVYVVGA